MDKKKPLPPAFRPPHWRTALGVTVCLFGAGFLLIRPYFLTNDDALMALLAQGVGIAGHPTAHLLFINILAGWLLKFLYSLQPGMDWYGWFFYGVFFLSTWALTAILMVRVRSPRNVWTAALVLLPAFFCFFARPQYTVLAFLAGSAAVCLAVFLPSSVAARTTALALIFFAGLFRFDAALLSISSSLPFILLPTGGSRLKDGLSRGRLWLAAGLFLLFAPHFLDREMYLEQPGWQKARQAVQEHSRIVEFKMPDYDFQRQAFQSVGWSLNDFALYIRWYWLDPKFSLEKVEKLDGLLTFDFLNKFRLWGPVVFSVTTFLFLAEFLLLSSLADPDRRWILFAGLLWTSLQIVFLTAFLKMPGWVLYPQLGLCVSFCLFHMEGPSSEGRSLRLYFLALPLLAAMAFHWLGGSFTENRANRAKEKALIASMTSLSPSPSRLYFVWNDGLPFEAVSVFGDWDIFKNFHVIWLSWGQSIPPEMELLSRFRIADPLKDMVNREDVQFIYDAEHSGVYEKFMETDKGMFVSPRRVFSGGLFDVYRIQSTAGSSMGDVPSRS
jgi:hypothetical protein